MSLGWLSIGATKDITLTGLNVDGGTLFVDKVNNRVGVGINTQVGLGSTSLSNVLQVGETSVGISTLNPLSSSGIAMFSDKYSMPDTDGITDFGATLWINSTSGSVSNKGASIGLGGLTPNVGIVTSKHMTHARISGVQSMSTTDDKGDFVIETANTTVVTEVPLVKETKMYERMRVTSDGNVGIGIDNPSAKLHVNGNIISETGITNNGYRVDLPVSFASANSSTERVPNNTYVTKVSPSGTGNGWLGRIDDGDENISPKSERVNGIACSTGSKKTFAVGSSIGYTTLFNEGGFNIDTAYDNIDRLYIDYQGGFIVKYSDEGNVEGYTVIAQQGTVDLLSVSLLDSGVVDAPDIIVTGTLIKQDITDLFVYDEISTNPTFSKQIPLPLVTNGSIVGFVARYTHDLVFKNLLFLTPADGQLGEVIPTNCGSFSTGTVYVSGYFKQPVTTAALNISSINYAPSGTGSYGSTITRAAITTNQYDVFLCKYDIQTVSSNKFLAPSWLVTVVGSTAGLAEKTEAPSRSLTVDENTGDVYICGTFESGECRFYTTAGVDAGSNYSLTRPNSGTGALASFIAKYNTSGTLQWSTKVAVTAASGKAFARSLAVEKVTVGSTPDVVVIGSYNNDVFFYQANKIGSPGAANGPSVGTQQGLANRLSTLVAKYDGNGTLLWTTRNVSESDSNQDVVGMLVDIDQNNNIYTTFNLEIISSTLDNVTVSVFQSQGTGNTIVKNHSVTGVADYIGVVCYNPDGKVLFTSKVDGSKTERVRAMDIYAESVDDPSRLVLGFTSGGYSFNCYDMTGISFKFMTGMNNTTTSNTTSAFVLQFPSFTFYLLEPPTGGNVKKMVNSTKNRAYAIPYYIPNPSDRTKDFTKNIFAIPSDSSIELSHVGEEGWLPLKDTDVGSIYVDKINGGIGIGTTEPQYLLHVEGDAFVRGDIRIDGLIINPFITFGLSGAVGIGTTDPQGFLHIYKPDPKIIIQSSVNSVNEVNSGTLDLLQRNRTGARLTYDGLTDNFYLKMLVTGNEKEPTALTITNKDGGEGFVGIGTSEPAKRLHVKDSFRIESKSRYEPGNSIEEQQVKEWAAFTGTFTGVTFNSCAYAPTAGELGLGRWGVVGFRSSNGTGRLYYTDDGGDTWVFGSLYQAPSNDTLREINPRSYLEYPTPISDIFSWQHIQWIEAAPTIPSEEELPTLTSNTVLPYTYSGTVKVSGTMTLTLPFSSSTTPIPVGREILIIKTDTTGVVTVTCPSGRINASTNVYLGPGSESLVNGQTVNNSSRYALRIVWANQDTASTGPDEFWNVTGPNNHPSFPDGVFVAVNRATEDNSLAYSYKHKRQLSTTITSKTVSPPLTYLKSSFTYKINLNTDLDVNSNVIGPEPNIIGPPDLSDYLIPYDIKTKGSFIYMSGVYKSNSGVFPLPSIPFNVLPATNTQWSFVVKLNASDYSCVWGRAIPASGSGENGIAIGSDDSVYMTGRYSSTSDVTLDGTVKLLSTGGGSRLFVAKLNSSGTFTNAYNSSTNGSFGRRIVVSGSYIFFCGNSGTNIPFMGRLNTNITSLLTKPISTNIADVNFGISLALSPSGDVYFCGHYNSTTAVDLGNGIELPAESSSFQSFLIKFNTSLEAQWARSIVTTASSSARDVTVDSSGNIYITGSYQNNSTVYLAPSVGSSTVSLPASSVTTAFIVSYNSAGNSRWAKSVPATTSSYGNSLAVYSGNVYVTGLYNTNPNATISLGADSNGDEKFLYPNSFETTNYPSPYLIKYSTEGYPILSRNIGMKNSGFIQSYISVDTSGNLYLTGDFIETSRLYNKDVTQIEAGESWFLVPFNVFSASVSAYDSMANRLMIFNDSVSGCSLTNNIGRDNTSAGNFWNSTAWLNPTTNIGTSITGAYYKQGSIRTNSYILTSRDAKNYTPVGTLYYLLSSRQDIVNPWYSISDGSGTEATENLREIAYAPELNRFVMCGREATNRRITIINPNNVVDLTSSSNFRLSDTGTGVSTTHTWEGVTWAPELGYFVAVADSGTINFRIIYSADGITWINVASPYFRDSGTNLGEIGYKDVKWGYKTGFLAVGAGYASRSVARTYRYPEPDSILVDTVTEIQPDGTLAANLLFGTAPLYTPLGDAPLYMVRAWVVFNGAASSSNIIIKRSGNVSAVTYIPFTSPETATGTFEIVFRTPLPSRNYAIFVTSPGESGINNFTSYTSAQTKYSSAPSVTRFRINVRNSSGANIDTFDDISVMVVC